jgi:hypothetical protein
VEKNGRKVFPWLPEAPAAPDGSDHTLKLALGIIIISGDIIVSACAARSSPLVWWLKGGGHGQCLPGKGDMNEGKVPKALDRFLCFTCL